MNKKLFIDIVVDEIINNGHLNYTLTHSELSNEIFLYFYNNRMSDENGVEVFSIEEVSNLDNDTMQAIFDKTDFCKKKFNLVKSIDKKQFFKNYPALIEYIEESNSFNYEKIYLFEILDSKDNYQEFLNSYEKVNFKNKLLDKLPEKNIPQKRLKI